MQLMMEFLMVAGRILTILPIMLVITLYMGKRSIGELPVFDFLVMITLGSLVGSDIADGNIAHIHTAEALVIIGLLQIMVSKLIIRFRKLGHLITFEPTIVIQDGQFIMNNLKRVRYSIDNVLQMLREKNVFELSDVHIGIIEASGNLSVLKKDSKASITLEDMNLTKKGCSLSYPIIVDGEIYENVLRKLNLSDSWLQQQLLLLNIKTAKDVFFASVNTNQELHVSLKNYMNDEEKNILPIFN